MCREGTSSRLSHETRALVEWEDKSRSRVQKHKAAEVHENKRDHHSAQRQIRCRQIKHEIVRQVVKQRREMGRVRNLERETESKGDLGGTNKQGEMSNSVRTESRVMKR